MIWSSCAARPLMPTAPTTSPAASFTTLPPGSATSPSPNHPASRPSLRRRSRNAAVDIIMRAAVKAFCCAIQMLRTGAPSIRAKYARNPLRSHTDTQMGRLNSAFAFAIAASTICRALSNVINVVPRAARVFVCVLVIEDGIEDLRALPLPRLGDEKQHARAVLDVARRQQLAPQQLHDQRRLGAVEAPRIAAAVLLGEERGRPLVVHVPQLLEQLRREARAGLHLERVLRRLDAVGRQRGALQPAVLRDRGLVLHDRPEPRDVDAVRRQIVHEPQLQLVVVDGDRNT